MSRSDRPLVLLWTRDPDTFSRRAADAIAEEAALAGWDLLDMQFTNGVLPSHRPIAGALIEWIPSEPNAKILLRRKIPVVRLGRLPHPRDGEVPAVIPDAQAVGRLAADHFIDRQFRRLAFVGRKPWHFSRAMYEAYADRAKERGCEVLLLRFERPPHPGEDRAMRYARYSKEFLEWLRGLATPIGLLGFSDLEAARLCAMTLSGGLKVPEDVALLGLGNRPSICGMAPVPLSSIMIAQDEWGRQGVRVLSSMMRGDAVDPITRIAPLGVVSRTSTDVLAVSDPMVATAIRYLWDHLAEDLSVDDVAAAVSMPRRSLERGFRTHLKRGVNAELRRKRLERCCELLRATDLTVEAIARQTGFRSADYLHASFKKAIGNTPARFRQASHDA